MILSFFSLCVVRGEFVCFTVQASQKWDVFYRQCSTGGQCLCFSLKLQFVVVFVHEIVDVRIALNAFFFWARVGDVDVQHDCCLLLHTSWCQYVYQCFVFHGVSIKAVSAHYYQLYTAYFSVCQLHVKEFSVDNCHLLMQSLAGIVSSNPVWYLTVCLI